MSSELSAKAKKVIDALEKKPELRDEILHYYGSRPRSRLEQGHRIRLAALAVAASVFEGDVRLRPVDLGRDEVFGAYEFTMKTTLRGGAGARVMEDKWFYGVPEDELIEQVLEDLRAVGLGPDDDGLYQSDAVIDACTT